MWRFGCIAILPLMLATPLAAQDGSGCDKFAWSLVTVQAQFAAPNIATVSAGTELSSVPTQHSCFASNQVQMQILLCHQSAH
jgi:hypothetical protein